MMRSAPMLDAPLLDFVACDRARLARDSRFDGRFFTGVRTTGIYCRPVCPVKPAKSANVRFFPTAAAAEQAGFRPCLRCRPETAPGSPAWRGSRTTVARGMRMIDAGFLDRHGVAALADRLGVGARHLARLFRKHLGAPPLMLARTRRVQRAKCLLDETDLPMARVALEAGFASLRRFNAAFRQTYGCPPSALRRGRKPTARRATRKTGTDARAIAASVPRTAPIRPPRAPSRYES